MDVFRLALMDAWHFRPCRSWTPGSPPQARCYIVHSTLRPLIPRHPWSASVSGKHHMYEVCASPSHLPVAVKPPHRQHPTGPGVSTWPRQASPVPLLSHGRRVPDLLDSPNLPTGREPSQGLPACRPVPGPTPPCPPARPSPSSNPQPSTPRQRHPAPSSAIQRHPSPSIVIAGRLSMGLPSTSTPYYTVIIAAPRPSSQPESTWRTARCSPAAIMQTSGGGASPDGG